jgi:nucleoid-associated protein YgaU
MVRQMLLAGLVVLLPAGLRAQGHGAMAPVSHAGAMAPTVVMPASHAMPIQAMPGPRTVARVGTVRPRMGMPVARNTRGPVTTRRRFDSRFDQEDFGRRPGCNSAPGLGFDAVHQAAICGSGVGFGGRGFAGSSFFPFFDGGFFLPGSPAALEDSSAAEPAQPEATDADARETTRRRRTAQPVMEPAPTNEAASAAPTDNEQFVFVRRDGTLFFAVGYTWENGTLRYVTEQGLRHTVTQDALDLDATRQFNEQRGLNFRLPS